MEIKLNHAEPIKKLLLFLKINETKWNLKKQVFNSNLNITSKDHVAYKKFLNNKTNLTNEK